LWVSSEDSYAQADRRTLADFALLTGSERSVDRFGVTKTID
jgi:hypothetical protein